MGCSLPVLTTATPGPRRESPPIMRFIETLSPETIHLLRRIYQQSQQHRVRQRAPCILLSFQRHSPRQLAPLFGVDRITIYHWLDAWTPSALPVYMTADEKAAPQLLARSKNSRFDSGPDSFPKISIRFGLESKANLTSTPANKRSSESSNPFASAGNGCVGGFLRPPTRCSIKSEKPLSRR